MTTKEINADALTDAKMAAAATETCAYRTYAGGWIFAHVSDLRAFAKEIAAFPTEQHEASPADRRHVGDSKFEGRYADYATKGETNQKQIARDAYAAGTGDMTQQPDPAAPSDEVLGAPADECEILSYQLIAAYVLSKLVAPLEDAGEGAEEVGHG